MLSLFLVGGFLATVLFQATVFFARIFDAVLSHVDQLWRPAVPGLIVFLAIGQPVLQISQYYFEIDQTWVRVGLIAALLILSAGLSAAILFVFPILRGINSTLLLVAAFGGRAVMFPFEFRQAYTSGVDFAVFLLSVLVCTFFLFIALQQRYRLQLSPYFERFIVPRSLLLAGIVFTILGFFLYFWLENLKADPFFYQNGDLVVRPGITGRWFVPGSLVLFCMTYWLIASFTLNLLNTNQFPEFLTRSRLYRASGAACLAFIPGLVYLVIFFDSNAHRSRIVQYADLTAEMLSLPGVLLDEDDDSNSAWPGGDPNDLDPCVRNDFQDRCLFPGGKKITPYIRVEPALVRPANFERKTMSPASGFGVGTVSRTILLTYAGSPGGPDLDTDAFFRELARNTSPGTEVRETRAVQPRPRANSDAKPVAAPRPQAYESRLLLAVNSIPDALPALLQSLDGVEYRTGARRRSIFSELAEAGFRTICGGRIAGRKNNSYLGRDHSMDLDSGCQVYVAPDQLADHLSGFPTESGADPGILPVTRAMIETLGKYREKHTVLWIHFDGREAIPAANPAVARAEFAEAIALLRKAGNLMIVPLGGGEKLSVPVWVFAQAPLRTPPGFEPFRHLLLRTVGATGVNPPAPGFEDNYTGILTTPWISATWASALFFRLNISYPLITYKRKSGHIEIFDGITGARWTLPERNRTQP